MIAPTTHSGWPVRGPSRRAWWLAAVGALLMPLGGAVLAATPNQPAPPQPDFGIRPGFYGDTTLPGDHYTFSLEPGTSINDTVVIFNFTRETQQFDLYGADLILAQGGGFAPAARGVGHQGSGAWITPGEPTVEVPAGSHLPVPITIAIPHGAVPGDHPGTIVVERHTDSSGPGVTVVPRVALRVMISVPGEINLGVDLGPLEAERVDGTVRFTVPIANTGNVTFTTAGTVTILSRGVPFDLALRPDGLYAIPGGEATLWTVWDHPPWVGRVQAHADVDITVGNHDPVRHTTETITIWLIPWLAISIALGVVVLTTVLLLATRKRRERWRHRRQQEHALVRRFRENWDGEEVVDLTKHERAWASSRRRHH